MPVGLPTPRHRMPPDHNTVTQMTQMYDAWGQPPPPPPPPWAMPPGHQQPASWHGALPTSPPPPPHPAFLTAGARVEQDRRGNIDIEDFDDSQSEGSIGQEDHFHHHQHHHQHQHHHHHHHHHQHHHHHHHHHHQHQHQHHHHHHHHHHGIPPPPPGLPPPPGGFPYMNMWMNGGIPPPPPQFHQHQHHHHHHHHHHQMMMGVPPQPPPPLQMPRSKRPPVPEAAHTRSTSASRNRTEPTESERQPNHASTQFDEVLALQADMRSTSPSRRQIARLQRLVDAARESSASGEGKAALDPEEQEELEALQQQQMKMSDKAALRQSTHKSTVREMISGQRKKVVRGTGSKSLPKQISTPKATISTPRTTTTRNMTSTNNARQSTSIPAPVISRTTGVRTKRSTVSPAPTRSRRGSLSARNPSKANRNALFVQEAHKRLRNPSSSARSQSQSPPKNKTNPYGSSTDFIPAMTADDRVLTFLRKDVLQDNGLKKASSRLLSGKKKEMSTTMSTTTPRPQTVTSAADGKLKATERDYMEGLEDLHHKLRKTYLEIQRHPQRFLSQLTTHGTIGGDARTQNPAELFAELDVCYLNTQFTVVRHYRSTENKKINTRSLGSPALPHRSRLL